MKTAHAHIADVAAMFTKKAREHRELIWNICIFLGITILVTLTLYFYSDLDKGGLLSLAFTVILVIVVLLIKGKRPKDILEIIKEKEIPDVLVTFILMGATFIGLWLTIRVTGLYAIKNYIEHERYLYTPYDILEILSYILLTRLCLTLFGTFESIKKYKSPKKLVDTTIQAVLISIITLLPKYEDTDLIILIGFWGFVLVLLCMAILLVSLTFVRARIEE